MKNKKVLAIAGIVLLLASVLIIIAVNHNANNGKSADNTSYDTFEEANKAADFNLVYSDRLCGYIPTDYNANSSTIEVHFGNAGYIRKTLGVTDNSGNEDNFSDAEEVNIDGKNITLKGKDGNIYLAVWNYNNFAYTISLDKNGNGVSAEEMTEYIEATE